MSRELQLLHISPGPWFNLFDCSTAHVTPDLNLFPFHYPYEPKNHLAFTASSCHLQVGLTNMQAISDLLPPRLQQLRRSKHPKHSPLTTSDLEATDNSEANGDPNDNEFSDTSILLPASQPSSFIPLKATQYLTQSHHDIRVAVKTLLLSTLIYASIGIWLIWSMHGMHRDGAVTDIDGICMERVARYCKFGFGLLPCFMCS